MLGGQEFVFHHYQYFPTSVQSDESYSNKCHRLVGGSWVEDSDLPAGMIGYQVTRLSKSDSALVVGGWVQGCGTGCRSPYTNIYDGTSWTRGPDTSTAGRNAHCQASIQYLLLKSLVQDYLYIVVKIVTN